MDELSGRVAVVTGAASGIGLALCKVLAREGMKIVLADVEAGALEQAASGLRAEGHQALAVRTDVSDAGSVERLAEATLAAHGKVHVVCNNAGVTKHTGEAIWESTPKDWEWMLGVNLWGVIHGIRTFVPILVRQGEAAHVVNTASVGSFIPGGGAYGATKHAVASVTESLRMDLLRVAPHVGVSVLIPGLTATGIVDADRNRPDALANAKPLTDDQQAYLARLKDSHARRGVSPTRVARAALAGIKKGQFYVMWDPWAPERIRARAEAVATGGDVPGTGETEAATTETKDA